MGLSGEARGEKAGQVEEAVGTVRTHPGVPERSYPSPTETAIALPGHTAPPSALAFAALRGDPPLEWLLL